MVDRGSDRAAFEQRDESRVSFCDQVGRSLLVKPPVEPKNAIVLDEWPVHGEFRDRAAREPDHHDPALERDRPRCGDERVTSDGVENDVGPVPLSNAFHLSNDVSAPDDYVLGAGFARDLRLGLRTHDADHASAGGDAELHRGRTDSPGRACTSSHSPVWSCARRCSANHAVW